MELELPDELANEICNWLGIYEANNPCCPLTQGDDCCDNKDLFCCRLGVMTWLPDRIRQSVKNEQLLNEIR